MERAIYDNNHVTIKINNKIVRCLVDTGSNFTIISDKLASQMCLVPVALPKKAMRYLFSANGAPLPILGTVDVVMNFQGYLITHTALVVKSIQESFIIGTDFMTANKAVIDYAEKVMIIADNLCWAPLQGPGDEVLQVKTVKSICIPAYSEALVEVRCPKRFRQQNIIIDPIKHKQFKYYAVGRSLCCPSRSNGTAIIRILNFKPYAFVVRRGEVVGTVATIEESKQEDEVKMSVEDTSLTPPMEEETDLEVYAKEMGFKINPELTGEQRKELLSLLLEYRDVFATSLADIPGYPDYELELRLRDPRPIYQRQYKLSPEDQRECQRQIEAMVENNILEPTTNPYWNVPYFTVSKKDGSRRFVADMRRINLAIQPQVCALPLITDLLTEISAECPNYITSLDLFQGYYQLNVAQNSRDILTITAPDGRRYRYVRCPMGLASSPMAMITVLSHVLSRLKHNKQLFIYMDDALICSRSFPLLIKNMKDAFQTLRESKLRCNSRKCEFAMKSISYLGFQLSSDGITITDDKIKIIKSLKPPKDKKTLMQIMGLFTFLEDF